MTPSNVRPSGTTIAEIGDQECQGPEARPQGHALPGRQAADYRIGVSDPEDLPLASRKERHHLPLKVTGEGGPVTVTVLTQRTVSTGSKVTVTEAPTDLRNQPDEARDHTIPGPLLSGASQSIDKLRRSCGNRWFYHAPGREQVRD